MNTSEQAPPAPATPWGDTCPYLNIAKHHDVDYSAVLAVADYFIHGRQIPVGVTLDLSGIPLTVWSRVCDDVTDYAQRYKALQQGYAR